MAKTNEEDAMAQNFETEIYRLDGAKAYLDLNMKALPGVMPEADSSRAFGWVRGGIPAPQKSDCYVVEFIDERAYKILAYVDSYGRVFSASRPVSAPPARYPDLQFAMMEDQPNPGQQVGVVELGLGSDDYRIPARYLQEKGKFQLLDSWYKFGEHGCGLTLTDALVRAYFAFVFRPKTIGSPVCAVGLSDIEAGLQGAQLLPSLADIVRLIRSAEDDPYMEPPALASMLSYWLTEAGLERALQTMAFAGPDQLRLIKTVERANTYFFLPQENCAVAERDIWAMESALNRYLLVSEIFEDDAARATWNDVLMADAAIMSALPLQMPRPNPTPEQGEWGVRQTISHVMETLRLPWHVSVAFRADVQAGSVSFDVMVPDAEMISPLCAPSKEHPVSQLMWSERQTIARQYGLRVGAILAAAAQLGSRTIKRVSVQVRPYTVDELEEEEVALRRQPTLDMAELNAMGFDVGSDLGEYVDSCEKPVEEVAPFGLRSPFDVMFGGIVSLMEPRETPAVYGFAVFTREAFEDYEAAVAKLRVDPEGFFDAYGATDAGLGRLKNPFGLVTSRSSYEAREEAAELLDEEMHPVDGAALGARVFSDLSIYQRARARRAAVCLADLLPKAGSVQDAIALVRAEQAKAPDDKVTQNGCNRLMTALLEDAIDLEEQNEIVSKFLGDERCYAALQFVQNDEKMPLEQAVSTLEAAVAEADVLDQYIDTDDRVCRMFDSYRSRVVYNWIREGLLVVPDMDLSAEKDRRVVLVPDALYYSCAELVSLLSQKFDRMDDAIRYGKRCIQMAPTVILGYRRLARAYMLMGDMDSACDLLQRALHFALKPDDISMLYYQMAYGEWKRGSTTAAATCYAKAMQVSPAVTTQALHELQQLLAESGARAIDQRMVDEFLEAMSIPSAPSDALLDLLHGAARAAVNAHMDPVAKELLSLYLKYRPTDVEVNIWQSI